MALGGGEASGVEPRRSVSTALSTPSSTLNLNPSHQPLSLALAITEKQALHR